MKRAYAVLDVFTDKALTGNPLAIVFDGEGLETNEMQAIAGEFNLSETVFVQPAAQPHHSAAVRIFTPGVELPFAGHPTVGAAIALAKRQLGEGGTGDVIIVLEEKIGIVRCGVKVSEGGAFAEFDLPQLPSAIEAPPESAAIAAALSLSPKDIGFENHVPTAWSAGVPFIMVPVHDLNAAGRAQVNSAEWSNVFADHPASGVFVYCRECVRHEAQFHARMFAPEKGIIEDPATGSAIAAFSGAVVDFDEPLDGLHTILVEQGVEMGRPSLVTLEVELSGQELIRARIGGNAVELMRGELDI
ncbi:MAG: PhzF family phenazine biosynthesis protein [Pseudomonadota bacterium]